MLSTGKSPAKTMSLRSVHVVFIVAALSLLAFLGYWSGIRVYHGENSANRALAVFSAAGVAVGIPYLGWFLRKSKTLR